MCNFWLHPDYDHFYIPLTSKKDKFQPQTSMYFKTLKNILIGIVFT